MRGFHITDWILPISLQMPIFKYRPLKIFADSQYADIEKSADIADADINIGTPLIFLVAMLIIM